jgi:hypothetical protein
LLKLIALPFLATAFAGWFALGSDHLGRGGVEAAVKQQMNGTDAGVVTRSVHCSGKATALNCVLISTRGTKLHARIHVRGGEWRADWAPLRG